MRNFLIVAFALLSSFATVSATEEAAHASGAIVLSDRCEACPIIP